MSEQNITLVQSAYAAFGRGDVDGILATLADNISWEPVHGASEHVPWAGKRMGKEAVREFFRILDQTEIFDSFEPKEFIAQGDRVVVLGSYAGRTKTTNRELSSDWVMIFRCQDGKVTDFREFADSGAVNAAHEPRAAAAR
jgi:ketosteroid isomerase-like protein